VQTLLLDRTQVPELYRFHRPVSPITQPLLGAVRFSSLSRLKEHLVGYQYASGDEPGPSKRKIMSCRMYDSTWTTAKLRRPRIWLCGDITNCIEVKTKFQSVNCSVVCFKYIHTYIHTYTHLHTKSRRHYCLANARLCAFITKCPIVLKVVCINIVMINSSTSFFLVSFTHGKFHIVGTL